MKKYPGGKELNKALVEMHFYGRPGIQDLEGMLLLVCMPVYHLSQCMRFPTMWYERPAKPQISLRIRAV